MIKGYTISSLERISKIREVRMLYNNLDNVAMRSFNLESRLKEITEMQLLNENIKYHQIIYGLYHGKRIVINDYAPTNPYKSCDAINLKRNSSDLKEMLEESLGFDL